MSPQTASILFIVIQTGPFIILLAAGSFFVYSVVKNRKKKFLDMKNDISNTAPRA